MDVKVKFCAVVSCDKNSQKDVAVASLPIARNKF